MKKIILVIGLAFFFFNASAQTTASNQILPKFHTTKSKVVVKPISYSKKRSVKRLMKGYQGKLVELMASARPLKSDHDLFSLFGNVHYEKVANKGYVYYIPLEFSSNKAAQKFLDQMVKPKVPQAKLIEK